MKLKPGMLCITVSTPTSHEYSRPFLGKIVELVETVLFGGGAIAWRTEPTFVDPADGRHIVWCEAALRPISDPDIDVSEHDRKELTA